MGRQQMRWTDAGGASAETPADHPDPAYESKGAEAHRHQQRDAFVRARYQNDQYRPRPAQQAAAFAAARKRTQDRVGTTDPR
jgi:hypothetical protein